MKKTSTTNTATIANVGLQASSGVLEIVYGLGLLLFAIINALHLPSFSYYIFAIAVLIIFFLMNMLSIKPRALKNPKLLECNKKENLVVIAFLILGILGGLYVIRMAAANADFNQRQILFVIGLFISLAIMSLSLANKISRLMLYGQLVVLVTIVFIARQLSFFNLLYLFLALGAAIVTAGFFNYGRFIATYSK